MQALRLMRFWVPQVRQSQELRCSSRRLPQTEQTARSEGFSFWQKEQTHGAPTRWVPQTVQKLAASSLRIPQAGQIQSVERLGLLCWQARQNRSDSGFSCPQTSQIHVGSGGFCGDIQVWQSSASSGLLAPQTGQTQDGVGM